MGECKMRGPPEAPGGSYWGAKDSNPPPPPSGQQDVPALHNRWAGLCEHQVLAVTHVLFSATAVLHDLFRPPVVGGNRCSNLVPIAVVHVIFRTEASPSPPPLLSLCREVEIQFQCQPLWHHGFPISRGRIFSRLCRVRFGSRTYRIRITRGRFFSHCCQIRISSCRNFSRLYLVWISWGRIISRTYQIRITRGRFFCHCYLIRISSGRIFSHTYLVRISRGRFSIEHTESGSSEAGFSAGLPVVHS